MKISPQTFPGNMLTDANKGIDAIAYNRLHRPETVQVGSNTFGFVYDAAGNMLQRIHHHPFATLNPSGGAMMQSLDLDPGTPSLRPATDTLSYCGPFEYENGALSRVNFPGGYVSGAVAYHYIQDHQGNVRQVVNAATGAVVQENHYYPGGMLFAESTSTYFKPGTSGNTYRYGGKEFLTADGLNLSLHGARMYDPALLRFITPEPLHHQTPHLSAYLYCAANPVMYVDPSGMIVNYLGSENQRKNMMKYIETLKENQLFSSYFQYLEHSCGIYSICFDNTTYKGDKCPGYYLSDTKTIAINSTNTQVENFAAIIEETFHAFQDIVNSVITLMPANNREFEAKFVTHLIMNEENSNIPAYYGCPPDGIDNILKIVKLCIPDSRIDTRNLDYFKFNKMYVENGIEFVKKQSDNQPREYKNNSFALSWIIFDLLRQVSPSE